MNATQLQALRRFLFFSPSEASQMISNTTVQAWLLWEKGEKPIPDHITKKVMELVKYREKLFCDMDEELPDELIWCKNPEEWLDFSDQPIAFWRPWCSAMSELSVVFKKDVTPFNFDKHAIITNDASNEGNEK